MIGTRLKLAREASGFSLRDLEAAINGLVSAQAIGKYERNEMMPSSTVLLALSESLKTTPDYLLNNREIELTGVDFRKATPAGSKEERAVVATVLDRVERYLELEELIPDIEIQWKPPENQFFKITNIESAELAADALRKEWNLGIDSIPSMTELLEENGIKVIALELPMEVSGSKAFVARPNLQDVPVIVVNEKHNGERQRFTLAHELAHLVLEFIGLNDKDQEKAADRFAGAFLMAKEIMKKILGSNRTSISIGELVELKKIFKVSIASIVVRCSQIGILSKTSYSKLFKTIKVLGWNGHNSKEPFPFEAEIPERFIRLCYRAVSEGAVSISRAAELMSKSVRDLNHMMASGI